MPTELTFTVPLPPRELSPNGSHGHWSKKATAKRLYREDVELESRFVVSQEKWEAPEKAIISLTFCLKDNKGALGQLDRAEYYHPRDPDNAQASFKAGLDGLRDAGVVRGDEWDRVTVSVAMTKERGPWVEVCVTAL